ncbi:hypothetical protein PHAMO_280007 [Magnetospirillum molischianum DSM 120]|uniref:Uncharacterized protein n=1 Tax=Magnetospirillum molischianum DSM 120 TaxID=1150626 RepID=H8FSY5_MAGML|nr:hypothetical protein PHAMO_280007 [Magnetospirillum molischianum DSM 120]
MGGWGCAVRAWMLPYKEDDVRRETVSLKKRNQLFILFRASDLTTMSYPRDEEGLSWTTLIAPPNALRFLPGRH